MNNIATVLKVFKNSSIVTPQGEYKISRIFPSRRSAEKARYRFFFMDNGIRIYRRRTGTGRITYAYIGN
jgi:hypothetical protein